MADTPYNLRNNAIVTIPIAGIDAAGDMEPLPVGIAPIVSNANPTELQAVVSGSSLVMNALVWPMTNNGVRVEISVGALTSFVMIVTVINDPTPVAVGLDFEHATSVPQPVP
jgi:hypothetical protein